MLVIHQLSALHTSHVHRVQLGRVAGMAVARSAVTLTLIIALVHQHGLRGGLHGPAPPGNAPVPRAARHTSASCSRTACSATGGRRPRWVGGRLAAALAVQACCKQDHPTQYLTQSSAVIVTAQPSLMLLLSFGMSQTRCKPIIIVAQPERVH